ncbi:MAG: GNAT family N-acetyltransferase [Cyanobacteria bacterium P01_H01_bin.121]
MRPNTRALELKIRLAQVDDLPVLARLYRQTILRQAPAHYTKAQTLSWAASADDRERFQTFILAVQTFVALDDIGIVGFAGIGADGHVASTYVRHDRLHCGIGSTLLQVVLDYAKARQIRRLYSEASEFSLGLFQKFGFHHYDTERIQHNGVTFDRYLVERLLSPNHD